MKDALRHGESLEAGAPERALLAQFACVLAAGFLEDLIRVRLTEVARFSKPRGECEQFIESTVDRFQNADFDHILEITGRFSSNWRKALESLDDEIKSAVTSIVANRHLIAHGRSSGISLSQVIEYFARLQEFAKSYKKICT